MADTIDSTEAQRLLIGSLYQAESEHTVHRYWTRTCFSHVGIYLLYIDILFVSFGSDLVLVGSHQLLP